MKIVVKSFLHNVKIVQNTKKYSSFRSYPQFSTTFKVDKLWREFSPMWVTCNFVDNSGIPKVTPQIINIEFRHKQAIYATIHTFPQLWITDNFEQWKHCGYL